MKWFFNPLMLAGAVLGWFIFESATGLQQAIHHRGPGVIQVGDGDHSPEQDEEVAETEYRRHQIGQHGLALVFGIGFWVMIARRAVLKENAKSQIE